MAGLLKKLPEGVTDNDVEIVITLVRGHKGRILLVRRADDEKSRPGYWESPGGHRDEGETLEETAHREVAEEVGLRIKLTRKRIYFETPDGKYGVMFLADATSDLLRLRIKEHSAALWVEKEQISHFKPLHEDFVKEVELLLGKSKKQGSLSMRRFAEREKRDYDTIRDVQGTQAMFDSVESPPWESVWNLSNLKEPDRENFSAQQEPTKSMELFDTACDYGLKDKGISVYHLLVDALNEDNAIEECEATQESKTASRVRVFNVHHTPKIASIIRRAGLLARVTRPNIIIVGRIQAKKKLKLREPSKRKAEDGVSAELSKLKELFKCTITVKEKKGESVPSDVKEHSEAVAEWETCPEGCFFAVGKDDKRDIFEWAHAPTKEAALARLKERLKPLFSVQYPEARVSGRILFQPRIAVAPVPPVPAAGPPGPTPANPTPPPASPTNTPNQQANTQNNQANSPTQITLKQNDVGDPAKALQKALGNNATVKPNTGTGEVTIQTNQPGNVIPQVQNVIQQGNLPFKVAGKLRQAAAIARRRYAGYAWFKGITYGLHQPGKRNSCGCLNMHAKDDHPPLPRSIGDVPIRIVIIKAMPAPAEDLPLDSVFASMSEGHHPVHDEFDFPDEMNGHSGCGEPESDEFMTLKDLEDHEEFSSPPTHSSIDELDSLLDHHEEYPPFPPTAGRKASGKVSIRMGILRPRTARVNVPEFD